jgi:hypothetical protein
LLSLELWNTDVPVPDKTLSIWYWVSNGGILEKQLAILYCTVCIRNLDLLTAAFADSKFLEFYYRKKGRLSDTACG